MQIQNSLLGHPSDLPVTRRVTGVLVVAALVGFYLQISIGLPFSIYYLSGLALFGILLPGQEDVRLAATITLLALASIAWFAFSPELVRYLPSQLSSLMQMALALVASIGLFRALQMTPLRTLEKLTLWVFVLLSLGIILEVAGPLRPLSDAVREAIYDQGVYANDIRDERSFGWVRPKLFASEPSHVGKFYGLAIFMAVATAGTLPRRFAILVYALPGVILVSSPAILPGILAALGVIVMQIGVRRVLSNPVVLVALLGARGLILYEIVSTIQTRLVGTVDPSLYLRLVRPLLMVQHTLEARPILGYGIGSEEQLSWLFQQTTAGSSVPSFLRSETGQSNRVWGAAHFAIIVQLGAVGTFIWITALWRYVSAVLSRHRIVFFVYFAAFGIFIGVINTPFYWGQLMIVLAGLWFSERREQ